MILDEIKNEYDVVIMSGIPGSGKSTTALKIAVDGDFCSADQYFTDKDMNYNFDASKIGEAHKLCMSKYLKFTDLAAQTKGVGHHYTIIVDNTNVEAWEISPYVAIAEAHGLKVCILQVNCPEDIAAKRNTHGVPARTINRMANRLANRHLPPFWKVIQIDNN